MYMGQSLSKCVIDQDISDWNCNQGFIKGQSFSCNTTEDVRLRIYEKCEKVPPVADGEDDPCSDELGFEGRCIFD